MLAAQFGRVAAASARLAAASTTRALSGGRLARQAAILQQQLQKQQQQRAPPPKARPEASSEAASPSPLAGEMAQLRAFAASGELDRTVCGKTLARCASKGAWREAQEVMRLMAKAALDPDAASLAIAATAAAAGRQPDLAGRLIADARAQPLGDDPGTHTLLLRSCRDVGDAAAALGVWEQLRARGAWPKLVGLQHLLVACCAAGGGEWRRAREALEAAEATPPEGGGLASGAAQWNVVLSGCVRAGELQEARALLAQMQARRAADTTGVGAAEVRYADAASFNTLMHGYVPEWAGGEDQPARAARIEALHAEMQAEGCRPDRYTYSALLDVHQFDADRVSALLREMRRAGVGGSKASAPYAKAARSLVWAGRTREVWALLGRMEIEGVRMDGALYARLVAAAESVGLLDEADRLHRHAKARGLAVP
jgi:pentatricopeptide repeat protein